MRIADTADQLRCERDPASIRARQDELMAFLSARSGTHRQRTPDGRSVPLYVETNRWLADCPECGAGIEAGIEVNELTCLGCGRVYKAALPGDLADAIDVLEARPDLKTRNWYPQKGETVAELVKENELFGGIGVFVSETVDEAPTHLVTVETATSDSHDEDGQYVEGGLADELLKRFETGYTIRHDDEKGTAEVELIDKDTNDVAALVRAVGAVES